MKFALCIMSIALVVCLVQDVKGLPKPRDATLVKSEELQVPNETPLKPVKGELTKDTASSEVIPGRVWCKHEGEEPAEDEVCQRQCIPKGYSYGLCITNTCTCI